jgi:hypothetical protein
MHSEGRLAAGASMGDGLCGLATRHLETIFSGLNMKRPSAPRIRDAGAALPVESAVLDGEAIVMRSADRCDFEALRSRQGQAEAILVAYDIVWRSGAGRTCALSHWRRAESAWRGCYGRRPSGKVSS